MSWRCVSRFIGLVLLAAGLAKLSDPASHDSITVLLSVLEIAFAWLLWAEWQAAFVRKSTVILFLGFAAAALTKALRGDASCGCFGTLEINPWVTMVMDIALAVSAVMVRTPEPAAIRSRSLRLLRGISAVGLLIVATGVYTAARPTMVTGAGIIAASSRLILLEPEHWLGSRFPIADEIDVGPQLLRGRWVVVFFRYNCKPCQAPMPHYLAQAASGIPTALIELPPYAPSEKSIVPAESGCLYGRLRRTRRWIVRTPMHLELVDGQVVAVHDPAKREH